MTIKLAYWISAACLVLLSQASGEPVTSNAEASEYVLPSWGNGAPDLVITLAGDWKQEANKGPDFDVHWLSGLGGSLGIYVGHNPKDIETTAATAKTNLLVGGKQIGFLVTPSKDGQKTQAIVDHFFKGCSGQGVSDLKLHIMINGTTQKFMTAVQDGLKTLKPKNIANKVPEDTHGSQARRSSALTFMPEK